jgi:uncharacterized protein (DUF362 family)
MSHDNDRKKFQETSPSGSPIKRRTFLKGAALGTAGLMVGSSKVAPAMAHGAAFRAKTGVKPFRPDIIRFYPEGKSKVVQTYHAGAWTGEPQALNGGVLRRMLDISITELTGLDKAPEAWAALFKPKERIAIKVNTLFPRDSTHASLVAQVTESLREARIPAEQIIIFDRSGLEQAGYTINADGPGVRCSYTRYTEERALGDSRIRLSDILLDCDGLINVPILTGITFFGAGISFAMKNHFGTFDRPRDFHEEKFVTGVTEINNLADIKDRTRLIIGDILASKSYRSAYGRYVIAGNKILMSFDPVAHDSVGAQIANAAYAAEGKESPAAIKQAIPWLRRASEMGLGTAALENIDLVKIDL